MPNCQLNSNLVVQSPIIDPSQASFRCLSQPEHQANINRTNTEQEPATSLSKTPAIHGRLQACINGIGAPRALVRPWFGNRPGTCLTHRNRLVRVSRTGTALVRVSRTGTAWCVAHEPELSPLSIRFQPLLQP